MKYNIEIIKKVVSDFKEGKNKSQLSKEYKIPRPTIRYWISSDIINFQKSKDMSTKIKINECYQRIEKKIELYNLILGLYLGDGNISINGKKSFKLRIVQDNKYPGIIKEIQKSLSKFFDKKSLVTKSNGCSVLIIFDKNLPVYFPQHGSGKKHDREIELSNFQRENIDYKNLLRGLWISDGSFYKASDGKYSYERYNFTNKSTDIISLFEECLVSLDIKYDKRVKKNGIWVIQIQKKSEVDKMKKVVGVKS
jgi:hypothetical protein